MAKGQYDISRQLARHMTLRHMSIPDLARALGKLRAPLIRDWLKGKLVRVETVHRLARIFGVTSEAFAGSEMDADERNEIGRERLLRFLGPGYLDGDNIVIRTPPQRYPGRSGNGRWIG